MVGTDDAPPAVVVVALDIHARRDMFLYPLAYRRSIAFVFCWQQTRWPPLRRGVLRRIGLLEVLVHG